MVEESGNWKGGRTEVDQTTKALLDKAYQLGFEYEKTYRGCSHGLEKSVHYFVFVSLNSPYFFMFWFASD